MHQSSLRQLKTSYTVFGGYSVGVTPVPIPNTEVKPYCADDTAWVTVWESRSPPKFIRNGPPRLRRAMLFRKKKKMLDSVEVGSVINALPVENALR